MCPLRIKCEYKKFNYVSKLLQILLIKMGIGDWGLGIGDWAQSPIPNPQSPTKPRNKVSSFWVLIYLHFYK